MTNALIGHTGFVGSILARTREFDVGFNSSSIAGIRGQSYDRIVCAGVNSVKWWANQHAEEDRDRIRCLMDHLTHVSCGRFVLISTIDVFGMPMGMTEADDPDIPGLHAYGRNRLMFERFVRDRFPDHRIVRLPGLFGPGLKKNVIFDMMYRNQLELINPHSSFQWYPVTRLAADLKVIESTDNIDLINLVTEPVATRTIHDRFFPGLTIGAFAGPMVRYDLRTQYPTVLGGPGPYHLSGEEVMAALGDHLENDLGV